MDRYIKRADPLYKHYCVDCGKETPNHRCSKCLNIWKKKHGVPGWDIRRIKSEEDEYITQDEGE